MHKAFSSLLGVIGFIIGFLSIHNSAQGATKTNIAKAIGFVEASSVEISTILNDNKSLFFVRIHEIELPACGKDVSMNVGRMSVMKFGEEKHDEIIAVHVSAKINEGLMVIMDLGADGIVDGVAPQEIVKLKIAQSAYDQIIACVASQR